MEEHQNKPSKSAKIAFWAIIVTVATILIVFFGMMGYYAMVDNVNPQTKIDNMNKTNQWIDEHLSPMIPQPSLQAPESTPYPSIKISYTTSTIESYQNGFLVYSPETNYIYFIVNMTIENDGYNTFDTNYLWFNLQAQNSTLSVPETGIDLYATSHFDKWDTVNIQNGGTFSGTLVFQMPTWATSYALKYTGTFSQNYNIVWTEIQ